MKTIHLIAPSGASLDAKSPLLGIEWLSAQGIQIENATCVERVSERFAGKDVERLAELNQLTQLAPHKLVMAMRGGYGIHRLLPNIEWSAIAKARVSALLGQGVSTVEAGCQHSWARVLAQWKQGVSE